MMTLALVLLATAAPPKPTATLTFPPEAQVLKALRPEHPRLMALPEDVARLKTLIKEDPRAAAIFKSLRRDADKMLTA
jgi:hypothetical protein